LPTGGNLPRNGTGPYRNSSPLPRRVAWEAAAMTQFPALPPEGWYPNTDNTEQQRWWDGQAWTEHVAVGAPITPVYEPLPQQPSPQASPQPANPYGVAY